MRILESFWWPMVNAELYQFIRACAYCKLVNAYSHEAQQLLHAIDSDTPIDVVFLTFWEPWEHTRSGCILQDPHMNGFYDRIWAKSIHWAEENYIIPGRTMGFWGIICSIWASKNDCCGYRWTFSGMFRKTFQETLLIPVRAVSRVNHKAIIN